jgi:hypothetical protein
MALEQVNGLIKVGSKEWQAILLRETVLPFVAIECYLREQNQTETELNFYQLKVLSLFDLGKYYTIEELASKLPNEDINSLLQVLNELYNKFKINKCKNLWSLADPYIGEDPRLICPDNPKGSMSGGNELSRGKIPIAA